MFVNQADIKMVMTKARWPTTVILEVCNENVKLGREDDDVIRLGFFWNAFFTFCKYRNLLSTLTMTWGKWNWILVFSCTLPLPPFWSGCSGASKSNVNNSVTRWHEGNYLQMPAICPGGYNRHFTNFCDVFFIILYLFMVCTFVGNDDFTLCSTDFWLGVHCKWKSGGFYPRKILTFYIAVGAFWFMLPC